MRLLRQDTPVLIEPLHEPCCPVPGAVWRQLPTLQLPTAALRWYGDSLVRHITSWFWNALSGSTSPVSWVSHFQLYIDFMLATGRPGPVHTGRWQDGAETSPCSPSTILHSARRARWFAKVLKETLRHMKVEVEAGYVKPASSMILMFTGSLAVPWPPERLLLIDEWLLQHGSRTFRRQTRAIDGLPFAACSAALFTPCDHIHWSLNYPRQVTFDSNVTRESKWDQNGGLEHFYCVPYIGKCHHPN